MAYTLQQISDLRAAIAEGVTTVSSAGRTVSYRSLSEMLKVLRMMEADVAGQTTGSRRVYQSFQRD